MSRWTLTLSARGDWWKNFDAHNLETNIPSGTPTANNRLLASTSASVVSPRATALFHATDRINLWGSVGAGFRAPTLNELYRQFRVGTVLTLANELLGPERLTGGEAGVTVNAGNATVRATWYDNRIEDPVSNVTISAAGANVTQQRQNLGRTRVRGLQTDLDVRLGSNWRASGGYLFNDAKVTEFAANPALVSNALPQVPRHRGSMRLAFQNSRTSAGFGVQMIGRQFDDDLNARRVPGETVPGLPGYAVADAMVSHTLMKHVGVFFGVQNLFNQTYIVGTLPTTIGSPRLFDAGIRIGGNP
jgi:outer membrane receptor protein involved in Fe transport